MFKETLPVIHAVHPSDFEQYNDAQLMQRFVLPQLYEPGSLRLAYTHYDRLLMGVAVPTTETLLLPVYENLKAGYFLERRELGIINLGGPAVVLADDVSYQLQKLDCLYVGKGVEQVRFQSVQPTQPAVLYLLSAPAHQTCSTKLMTVAQAAPVRMGDAAQQNERIIYKYIHEGGIESCQLVMGLTLLQPGSVWNTMPPHLHDRRSEIYFYFDLSPNEELTHYMGYPDAYRELRLQNYSAVLSPPWSIHAGKGTAHYGFVWGMAGENKAFTDMDTVVFAENFQHG